MNDRNGQPIVVGDDYVLLAPVQRVDADVAVLDAGPGPIVVRPGDLLPASAIVTDHGELAGRDDDDHLQYLNVARGDARYYPQDALDGLLAGKSAVGHKHVLADVTDAGALAAQDTVGAAHLADGAVVPAKASPWLRPIYRAAWFETALTGWGGASAGSGTSYLVNLQFFTAGQTPAVVTAATVETGAGTSGTNARATFQANSGPVWLTDDTRIVVCVNVVNLAEAQAVRVGFWGDTAVPTATGRPDSGLWLEFDRALSATEWALVAGSGGAHTRVATGAVVNAAGFQWFELRFDSETAARLFEGTPSAATQLGSTIASNLPTGAVERCGRLFWQIEKIDPATSARAHCQLAWFGIVRDNDVFPVLSA